MQSLGRFAFAGRALAVLWASALFFWAGGTAFAHYSSIVVDAETGQVLMQHDPDAVNYPASLTKMMTLYLTFGALEQGAIGIDQRFMVSEHAASQEPSKLGLVPGSTIAVRDLILAICTHSANDAAVVVAENLAGSEPAFARRMTQQAHRLGMAHTNFDNASGLPDPSNVTTARDLAILARALYRDYPKEYHYFSTDSFTYKGTIYANHNHLMSSFAGMDGIKTGYIRAAGFNLAASAARDGRRLIGVVMGGESAHSRDMKMAALLTEAFALPAGPATAIAEDEDPYQSRETLAGRAIAALSPVARAEASTRSMAHERRPRVADDWSIQVGAFNQSPAAERAAAQALARLPARRGRGIMVLAPAPADADQVYRARIVHFTERDAQAACRVLHHRHTPCAVIAPETASLAAAKSGS